MIQGSEESQKSASSMQRDVRMLFGAAMSLALLAHARAQDYGHDFVTVGAPGNAAATPAGLLFYTPGDPLPQSVNYEFRITRTEVLTSQWFEFVQRTGLITQVFPTT